MLETLTNMGWPFAAASVGMAWAIAVPLIVRRAMRNTERLEELRLKRAIQLESFKKGAITYVEEHG